MTSSLATDDPVLLAFAEEVGTEGPITVAGTKSRWTVGGDVEADTRVVSAPSGVVSYAAEEMTVVVRAGTTMEELNGTLAADGQRTALPDSGTVGGALMTGENDHRSLGRGMARTAPLQIRYVSAEGRVVNSGGPTVKNVSGFDLPRLMIGSLGTLGLLAEVTLRTNPIPAVSEWSSARGVDPIAAFQATLSPSAVLWDGETTWVQLEGHAPDVAAEHAALAAIGDFVPAEPPALPAHRWSMPTSDIATWAAGHDGGFVACVGLGLVFADEPAPPRALDPAVAAIHERLKANFDPSGRLNPGRDPARR